MLTWFSAVPWFIYTVLFFERHWLTQLALKISV